MTVLPPVEPGTELKRAAEAVSNMEELVRRIDRGAHTLYTLGATHRREDGALDERAVIYLGETLTDLTSTLIEEWQAAFDILHTD